MRIGFAEIYFTGFGRKPGCPVLHSFRGIGPIQRVFHFLTRGLLKSHGARISIMPRRATNEDSPSEAFSCCEFFRKRPHLVYSRFDILIPLSTLFEAVDFA